MWSCESHDADSSSLRSPTRPSCSSLLSAWLSEAHKTDGCSSGQTLAPHRSTDVPGSLHKLVYQPPSPQRAAERFVSCEHIGDVNAHKIRSTSLPSCDGRRSHRTLRDLSMRKLSRTGERKVDAFSNTDVTTHVDAICVPFAQTSALRRTRASQRRGSAQKYVHWADKKSPKLALRDDPTDSSENKVVSELRDTAGPGNNLHRGQVPTSRCESPSAKLLGLSSGASQRIQRTSKNEQSGIDDFLQKLLLFSDRMVEIM